MTNKLKCPFCETKLEQGIELLRGGHILGCPKCKRNADDIFWFALIQQKKDLDFFITEQIKAQTALIVRTKELDICQKDLKIATKALEEILQDESDEWFYIAKHALEKIKQKERKNETSENQDA